MIIIIIIIIIIINVIIIISIMKRKKKSNKYTDFVSESKVANKMHDHYLHKSQPFLFVMKMIVLFISKRLI